jgi:hypothetical protein
LGWLVATYRDRPAIWHSGGIDGFATMSFVLTRDRIGVLVCANASNAGLPVGLQFELADRLLEEEPRPWLDRLHQQEEKAKEAKQDASKKERTVPGTSPSHPLQDYVGDYEHPGYGSLRVREGSSRELTFVLGELDLSATHRHFDTWTARYEALDIDFPVTFFTDADGLITEALAGLESLVAPIRFRRVPDLRLTDPAFLARLAGRYALADVVLEVALGPGGKLSASVAGQPSFHLEPTQGTAFVVDGAPGERLEFTVGESGPAAEVHTSSGVFARSDGDVPIAPAPA